MTEQLANFGHTTLAEALDDSETGVDVTAGSVFPASGDFRVLVDSEIMKVTARATNTLTVERGAEGTTAASHSNGADIDARLTAEGLRQMMSEARGIPNGVISTKAYHNTTQGSLAASGFNALDLNSEDWDTDNLHDPSTNNSRITIKTAGKYLLHGSSYVTQTWVPYLKLNGTQIGAGTDTTINQIGEVSLVLDLAVDDFGTGYSSLSYLKRFPIDTLKIDQSFVADLDSADGAAIVDAILALSKTLNLRVIAEGIEDQHQLAYLVKKECDLLQGFYFARPIYPEDVPDMLRQNFSEQIREATAG